MSYDNAVTPQMFGAMANGIIDDTEAFQQAVDSGYDVFVPTSRRETYRITKPIRITNKQCKRIFSEPVARSSDKGAIIFDLNNSSVDVKTIGLFDVHIQLLHLSGLRIISKAVNSHRAGILVNAMDENVCDYDILINQCEIINFYKVCRFTGRGLEITNSKIGSCQYLTELYWNDEKDTNKNHPPQYDQRGIAIKNCRLHNIASAFLIVRSGHAYGLHFTGNTIDNGKGYLVRAYDQAYGWNIGGNVIQGIQGEFDFMTFKKGMRDCVITGNTFLSDKGYWIGTESTVNSWIKCAGDTQSCIISNNVFKNTEGGFMAFKNLYGSSIVGNVMHNETGSKEPEISASGKCAGNAICGNTFTDTKQLSKGNAVAGNYPV